MSDLDPSKWLSDWRHWRRETMEATARRVKAERELLDAKCAEADAAAELEKFTVGVIALASQPQGPGDGNG